MWYIPDNQIVKIQNRMSDIREIGFKDSQAFMAATFELLGTLDTVMFDERNWERKKKETMILDEDKKPYKKERFEKKEEHKPNSHERRKERRRLEREENKKKEESNYTTTSPCVVQFDEEGSPIVPISLTTDKKEETNE